MLKVHASATVMSAGTVFAVVQGEISNIGMNSVVSVAVLIAVIGAAWNLSAKLTKIEQRLRTLTKLLPRVQNIENHFMLLEEDLNNVWAAVRIAAPDAPSLSTTRKPRFRPLSDDGDSE